MPKSDRSQIILRNNRSLSHLYSELCSSRRSHHQARKDEPFNFGPAQIAAQEDLKFALLNSPAIRAIDYTSSAPIILAVDTSNIAIGFFLVQCDLDNL